MRQEVKLGTLGDIFIGLTYKPENVVDTGGTVVLRSSNIQEDKIELEDIVRVDCPVREKLWVKDNDILMCSRNGSAKLVGKTALINNLPEDMTFGAFMTIIRTPYNNYLQYYFKSPFFRRQLNSSATTTINQITRSMLDDMVVPVFDPETTEQITETLSKCEQIIYDRKRELQKMDELIKARFVEMFGDPNTNTKNWTMGKISDIGKCVAGATPSTAKKEYWENGTIPWLSSGEVNKGRVYETDTKITQLGYDNASTKMVPAKTVLLAMAGQGKTRGTAAITEIELCTNQSICSIVNNEKVNAEYLLNFLKLQYKELRNASTSSEGRGGLNLKIIGDYPITVPPIELQNDYEAFCKQLDKSKVAAQKALEEAQLLFDSLMQKYFG